MKAFQLQNDKTQLIFCINKGLESEKMFKDPVVAEKFVSTMEKYEAFTNLTICTYALVNHKCYMLIRQNIEKDISLDTLLKRVKNIISEKEFNLIKSDLAEIKNEKDHDAYVEQLKKTYCHRMNDYREFFRTLKVSFSSWYNGYIKEKNNLEFRRSGYVFNPKFKRLLVEDKLDAAKVIASYIDLLPLREDVTSSLEEYQFSNFGAAMQNNSKAQGRLVDFLNYYMADDYVPWNNMNNPQKQKSWEQLSLVYDNILFEDAELITDKNGISRRGISKERFLEATESHTRKKFTLNEACHCHTKYFTYGAAFGSKKFCEATFNNNLDMFSKNRKDGTRRMLKLNKNINLFSLHQPQLNAIRPPNYLDISKEIEERKKKQMKHT